MAIFERDVEINEPVEKVWAVLTDTTTWQKSFPYGDSVSNLTSPTQGSTFNWESNGQLGTMTIMRIEPNNRLEVLSQFGDKDTQIFTFKSNSR